MTGHVAGDEAPLRQAAESALEELRAGASEVHVGRHGAVGTAHTPGFTRAVRVSLPYREKLLHLAQEQALLEARGGRDVSHAAVLQVVLTALPEQFEKRRD